MKIHLSVIAVLIIEFAMLALSILIPALLSRYAATHPEFAYNDMARRNKINRIIHYSSISIIAIIGIIWIATR